MSLSFIRAFLREEDGQDLVEYALLLALVGIAATAMLTGVKNSVSSVFSNVGSNLNSAAS